MNIKSKIMGLVLALYLVVGGGVQAGHDDASGDASAAPLPTVYFTTNMSAEGLLKVYANVSRRIDGKTAIKWHSGEPNGPNLIPRDMVKALQESISGSVLVEANTLYKGARETTAQHRETLSINGWDFCTVDIMDEHGATMLPIRGGRHFKEMSLGQSITNYDSMVVLTHFKGHAMGGFGGSIKNIGIGNADGQIGKRMVHGANETFDFGSWANGKLLMEYMVESAKATTDLFGEHIAYINVLRNMSVDCDCAGSRAAAPKARDIGILASTDIVAIDQAAIDMVYALPEAEKHDLCERIESREGLHQLVYGEEMGLGRRQYTLMHLDE